MEVVRRFLVFSILCLTISGCNQQKTSESIFVDGKAQCGADAIANRFIVKWLDGRITVENGSDKDSFLKEFVDPNLNRIELVEHDYQVRIQEGVRPAEIETAAVAVLSGSISMILSPPTIRASRVSRTTRDAAESTFPARSIP